MCAVISTKYTAGFKEVVGRMTVSGLELLACVRGLQLHYRSLDNAHTADYYTFCSMKFCTDMSTNILSQPQFLLDKKHNSRKTTMADYRALDRIPSSFS